MDCRFHRFYIKGILERDKISLVLFESKDKSLAALDNLSESNVLVADIFENLQGSLENSQELQAWLNNH